MRESLFLFFRSLSCVFPLVSLFPTFPFLSGCVRERERESALRPPPPPPPPSSPPPPPGASARTVSHSSQSDPTCLGGEDKK